MSGIAIYVEGGGDTAEQKAELRQGFDVLFSAVKTQVRAKRLQWKLVCAGSRNQAYDAFINALNTNPNVLNVLLVDSETQVKAKDTDNAQDAKIRVEHLTERDGWSFSKVNSHTVHLMAQCMEAWIVADSDALADFYGKNFLNSSLPTRQNLEDEPKKEIYAKLSKATKDTKKGEYGKIKHASKLLQKIATTKVRERCPRFVVLMQWLEHTITTTESQKSEH